ncbi:adenylate/guanylate cyclase domain-containing protein [Ruegeria sp. R8_2]|nr:adenylate/guanylate cyclase domain-containing protein [Ruegeria sp. R8_1]MBO9415682.1 adenylate/guanylate cyclase domain-containing protein [Ruegeria sp. R8_2]
MERRLATILSIDVVGYSRLMERGESATLAALKSHRLELIDPFAASFGGKMIKLMGDGALLEFESAVLGGFGDGTSHVAGWFMDGARHLALWFFRTASAFKRAGVAVGFAGAVAKYAVLIRPGLPRLCESPANLGFDLLAFSAMRCIHQQHLLTIQASKTCVRQLFPHHSQLRLASVIATKMSESW